MTTAAPQPVAPLSYAHRSVVAAVGSPVAAGFWVMFGGLTLIFFGGCFCIGILALVEGTGLMPAGPRVERTLLMLVLYVLAITCFVTGAWVMSLGVRKLMSVGR